ncbi:unnamed protein product [Sphagnum balticum]
MTDFHDDLNFGISLDGDKPAEKGERKDPVVAKQEEEPVSSLGGDKFDLKKAAHPGACVATFAFKLGALFFYLIIGSIISNIITFIFVILLSSLDFWVVKNVTGRLLVGLRWWS